MWYQEAVFYELSIRAFCDGNGDGVGDFIGATSKLDYLQSLGVNCLWILPHYPSPLRDDGYDVADYKGIHPDLGTLDDFKRFLAEAHARGLRVVTDLVMNHTSDQHFWFQQARQGRENPYHDYYVWSDTATEYSSIRLVFPDFEPSNWTWDDVAGRYFWHRFFRTQPDLNFDNPTVQEAMLEIVRFWLDLGVDGFRLDAVIYLYEREGTDGAGLPETHAYIKRVRQLIDQHYPDRVLIAEANDWPEQLMAFFGDDDACQMCFHFPLMPRLYLALLQGDARPIHTILARTPTLPPKSQWLSFLRNHDELTLEMVTPDEARELYTAYAPDPRMKINNGIRRRLAPILDGDVRQYRLLTALLMSLSGTPILYYGDEIGMRDNIALPDRHGCRTPMQWDESKNGGFSSADSLYLPINSDYPAINVSAEEKRPDSFLQTTRQLIHSRQASPALRRGQLRLIPTENHAVFAFWRESAEERVLCLYNLSAEPQPIPFTLDALTPLWGKSPQIELEPYSVCWFIS